MTGGSYTKGLLVEQSFIFVKMEASEKINPYALFSCDFYTFLTLLSALVN